MKNIWILIRKYNAFFLFLLFFAVSFLLLIRNNGFQRSSALNSSNALAGRIYEHSSRWKDYLSLRAANEMLALENAEMHAELQELKNKYVEIDSTVQDSLGIPQYRFVASKVINNSVHQKNNYLTVDKGSNHGVKKGMAVIGPTGIVGIVLNVSPKYATIQSVLHHDTRISAALVNSQAFGSLIWGENLNPQIAILRDIPNHVQIQEGEKVVTSGYSLFPSGIAVGTVRHVREGGGESFHDIEIQLSTDFNNLQFVYVVMDRFDAEKLELESSNEPE